ncbi:unnamed protein product [marine sediment metagenome]|uniref:Uncharacterized protein n=1 Tax=marine sediment metagenome TaxID=412755 RepID=X1G2Q9_9ZZZZ
MKSEKIKLNHVRDPEEKVSNGAEEKISNGVNAMRYALYATLAVCLLVFTPACETTNSQKTPQAEQIQMLRREKTQLIRQIEQYKSENKQLKKQIKVLAGLKPKVKLENLYSLQKIAITRYTNLYDKDKDAQYEKLIVYIQPLDGQGDIVKAPGTVDVQLWDLNKEASQALLGQWQVTPDQLKKLWFTAILSSNYRLMFDVADKIERLRRTTDGEGNLYRLSDRQSFQDQKVIKPR